MFLVYASLESKFRFSFFDSTRLVFHSDAFIKDEIWHQIEHRAQRIKVEKWVATSILSWADCSQEEKRKTAKASQTNERNVKLVMKKNPSDRRTRRRKEKKIASDPVWLSWAPRCCCWLCEGKLTTSTSFDIRRKRKRNYLGLESQVCSLNDDESISSSSRSHRLMPCCRT